MAYTKTTWIDRIVQFANRYTKSGETSSEVTLVQSPGTVTQAGTAVNATNLNKMEQGIEDAHTHIAATTGIHGADTAATPNRIVQRDSSGDITGRRLISGVADGTAPLGVTSATLVPNLNADRVDGMHFRTSSGYVEYDDGSGWKPVANNGVSYASDTVQFSDATEYTIINANKLIYKWVPRFTGEVKVSFDSKVDSGTVQIFLQARFQNRQIGTNGVYLNSNGAGSAVDWTTPIGTTGIGGNPNTQVDGVVSIAASNNGSTTTTYVTTNDVMTVFELAPIYFVFSSSGASITGRIKNLIISYDVVR